MSENKVALKNTFDLNDADIKDWASILKGLAVNEKEVDFQLIESIREADEACRGASNADIEMVVKRIQEGLISGSVAEYHNLSVTLANSDKKTYALEVCLIGLKSWPKNIDLNADAIKYATEVGRLDLAETLVNDFETNCPDKNSWNWRGFTFVLDYLMTAKPDQYINRITNLIEEYKKNIPFEEKAYVAEADFFIQEGQGDKAVETLEYAIKSLSAPQSALKLSDIYMERGQYENVIRTASLGIAYAAEVQPSIRTAYLLMIRALAKDALYHKKAHISGRYSSKEAEEIIKEYRLAEKYVSVGEKENIRLRIAILQAYAMDQSEE